MQSATTEKNNLGPGFERRHYDELRRQKLAPKLGQLGVAGARVETNPGHERRWRDELISALAETMEGRVNTEYPFELINGKLVAEDGEAIEDLVERGFRESVRRASGDSFYAFLPERSRHELDEVREDQAMARGETAYNTTAKFSPYTEELDTSEENRAKLVAANQKPYWQRGMFRLKHWDDRTKKLYLATLSIDNSSVNLLQEVAAEVLGYRYRARDSTGTLGETIRLNIPDESWRAIPGRITTAADSRLARQRGGEWLQGRKKQNSKNTQKYVESQYAILNHLSRVDRFLVSARPTYDSYLEAFRNELYNQAALLDETRRRGIDVFTGNVQLASAAAGHMAREEGRTYDACGLLLDGGNKVAKVAVQTGLESLLHLAGQELICTNPKCRKRVVVPTKDLEDGKLSCSKCGLVYDVCTKEAKFDERKIASLAKNQSKETPKESDWQRIVRQDNEKKAAAKQKRRHEELAVQYQQAA